MKEILENNSVKLLNGIVISCVVTFILLFIYSVLLTYTGIGENTMAPIIILITAVSILIGSSIGAGSIKKNGILNGGIIGLIYILVIYLLSGAISHGFQLNVYSVIMMCAGIGAGMIGGVVGVNLK